MMCCSALTPAVAKRVAAIAAVTRVKDMVGVKTAVVRKERKSRAL